MRLKAALVGNLKAYMAAELKAAKQAVGGGVRAATDGLKLELRGQIVKAGLGDRLSKSWRGNLYPRNGLSINAAGLVYSTAPKIITAFTEGVTIRGKSGLYLAIPTDLVPRRKGKRMSPKDFAASGQKLTYVPPQGARRVGLLVLENQRLTSKGRARQASERAVAKGKVATVVMFILVPQVTLKKRLNVEPAGEKWIERLPELVDASWPATPESSGGE